jgi:zinc D-Ala-D-Ala dipeptidase
MNPLDFVDIERVIPDIIADIRYATENNFTGKKLYSSPKCYLRRGVALRLAAVQSNLKRKRLGLKIFDGYRPRSVQRIFWKILPDDRYVAPPKLGSKHNRGAAVDVTLVDENAAELSMPTPFDVFTEKAHLDFFDLPEDVLQHRNLLQKFMKEGGFLPLQTEWWHFDDPNWEQYPLEDISLEELARAAPRVAS